MPSDWTAAEVVALHKKGSWSEMGFYRPVSLTIIPCKILESIIRDHIMEHLVKNGLLSSKQYGFVKGRSTMLQLLNMLDKWTSYLENGRQVDAIYTDFEKAFNNVAHKRLISKLRYYGINSSIVDWIQDFLRNRKHRVKVNGSHSDWDKVTSGIPQGSVLGPLLFLLYINDLPGFCEGEAEMYLFADDAKLCKHILKDEDNHCLQASLDKLQIWSDIWLLRLN
jgi:Reverse transcriptase (RNA-dependent DNA polymerase)